MQSVGQGALFRRSWLGAQKFVLAPDHQLLGSLDALSNPRAIGFKESVHVCAIPGLRPVQHRGIGLGLSDNGGRSDL